MAESPARLRCRRARRPRCRSSRRRRRRERASRLRRRLRGRDRRALRRNFADVESARGAQCVPRRVGVAGFRIDECRNERAGGIVHCRTRTRSVPDRRLMRWRRAARMRTRIASSARSSKGFWSTLHRVRLTNSAASGDATSPVEKMMRSSSSGATAATWSCSSMPEHPGIFRSEIDRRVFERSGEESPTALRRRRPLRRRRHPRRVKKRRNAARIDGSSSMISTRGGSPARAATLAGERSTGVDGAFFRDFGELDRQHDGEPRAASSFPSRFSTSMRPPSCCTMPSVTDSPKPGAFAERLRREERLEDALHHVGRNARAGVLDDDAQLVGRAIVARRRTSPPCPDACAAFMTRFVTICCRPARSVLRERSSESAARASNARRSRSTVGCSAVTLAASASVSRHALARRVARCARTTADRARSRASGAPDRE